MTLYGIILILLSGLTFWFLILGGILIVFGPVYVIGGIFLKRPVPKPKTSLEVALVERPTGTKAKTGPGWHCTWCWGPLPENAAFCPTCGKALT